MPSCHCLSSAWIHGLLKHRGQAPRPEVGDLGRSLRSGIANKCLGGTDAWITTDLEQPLDTRGAALVGLIPAG